LEGDIGIEIAHVPEVGGIGLIAAGGDLDVEIHRIQRGGGRSETRDNREDEDGREDFPSEHRYFSE